MGNPVLGTLLGETAAQSLINGFVEGNAASALPTTLLPTAHGTDRTTMLRIEGRPDREKRNNTCVSPPGFFCGLNPVNPPEFSACTKNVGDYWSFIDLSNPKCEDDGIYVVYWHSLCDDSTCVEHAGGDTPSYGFFEVVEKTHDITLSKVINTTLANNSGIGRYPSRLPSTYTTFNGTSVNFTFDVPVDTWPISDPSVAAMTDWRLAQGDIVNNLYPGYNDWRKSCVEVDNSHLMKRRILDFHDPADPRWCEIDLTKPIKYGCARELCPPSDVD